MKKLLCIAHLVCLFFLSELIPAHAQGYWDETPQPRSKSRSGVSSQKTNKTLNNQITYSLITFKNDARLAVRILNETDSTVIALKADNDTIVYQKQNIARIEPVKQGEQTAYHIPATQAAFSLNAFGLKKGELTYTQDFLLLNRINYGVTDNINVTLGIFMPLAAFANLRINLPQVANQIKFGFGVSATIPIIEDDLKATFLYALMTLGSRENNVTFTGGIRLSYGYNDPFFGLAMIFHTGPKGYYYLEGQLTQGVGIWASTGYRHMINRGSISLGVVVYGGYGLIALPNIGFTAPIFVAEK